LYTQYLTIGTNSKLRYRSVRWLRPGALNGWTCITRHRLLLGRYHDVLHRPRTGRDGSSFPGRWFVLCVLDSLFRPCMGICNGLEVSIQFPGFLCTSLTYAAMRCNGSLYYHSRSSQPLLPSSTGTAAQRSTTMPGSPCSSS
jgi:hypothetical protein